MLALILFSHAIYKNDMYTFGQNCSNTTFFVWDDYLSMFSLPINNFVDFLIIWYGVVTKLKKKNNSSGL